MQIAMIGSGYVGLVSGACLADFGHEVTCIDNDSEKIAALKRGEIPIYEPDLDQLIKDNMAAARMFFSTDLAAAVGNSDVVFIAVGTPPRPSDGHADLSYVYAVAREIAAALKDFTVVVTKSTVPLGTGDEVERIIREINPAAGERFDPYRHQAMAAVESAAAPNTIVSTLQKGYGLHDRVLRPALVTVPKAVEKSGTNPNSDTDLD